jgi:hypothetical protein
LVPKSRDQDASFREEVRLEGQEVEMASPRPNVLDRGAGKDDAVNAESKAGRIAACCGAVEQAACCAPEQKSGCCERQQSRSCGCR